MHITDKDKRSGIDMGARNYVHTSQPVCWTPSPPPTYQRCMQQAESSIRTLQLMCDAWATKCTWQRGWAGSGPVDGPSDPCPARSGPH